MRIGIIGAGIGGLAAAAQLARSGHDISIVEAFDKAAPVGAGLLLQPPGKAVLKRLGLLEDAMASGVPVSRLHSSTTSDRVLLDISYQDLEGIAREGLGIQREKLHALLLKSAIEAGVKITFSAPADAIERESSRLFIGSNDEKHGPFDFVIVSSGSRSNWLKSEEFGRRASPYNWGCLWATVPFPTSLTPNTLHQRCNGTRKMIGILPTSRSGGSRHAALYWSLETAHTKKWMSDSYHFFLDELQSLWPEAAMAAASVDKNAFTFARYHDVWTKRPYNERVLLIGDAAHGTSPQLGQGASMALLDAFTVDQCLLDFPDHLDNAMEQYLTRRMAHQRYVRYASRALTPVFQHSSRYIGVLRDLFCGPLAGLPGPRGIAVQTLACELFNNFRSELT